MPRTALLMRDLALLIPVYNDQAGLDASLESIREEDNSFTVVVVDDGSREPITVNPEKFPFRLHLLRQEPNGGIVKALNTGLSWIVQEGFSLVARLDAADLQEPGRLRAQYEYLAERENIYLLGANVTVCEEHDGRQLFRTNLPLSPREVRRAMMYRNCFVHPTVMFRTEALRHTGFYSGRFSHIEDYMLFTEMVERFDAANIERPLVRYFVREGGISRLNHRKQLASGIRYKLSRPRPWNFLWYLYFVKRGSYFLIPHAAWYRLKQLLGFAKPIALD